MERRERYDPEDLESLLHERTYDELLEEERSYVLRHLSGKSEYESMRALLLNLRGSEKDRPLITSDDILRENVMRAFRERHKPQWKIWLNSVGGLFSPAENVRWNWRPALVLGSLVLVIAAGVMVLLGPGTQRNARVAELRRPERVEPAVPAKEDVLEEREEDGLDATGAAMITGTDTPSASPDEILREATAEDAQPMLSIADDEALEEVAREREPIMDLKNEMAESTTRKDEALKAVPRVPSGSGTATVAATAAPASVDALDVSGSERSRTQRTKVSGQDDLASSSKQKDSRLAVSGRTLSQDPEVLDLMASGW